jgi:predicted dehydrogenase
VFCEKPLGESLAEDAGPWWRRPNELGPGNMIGFNYMRTPASQFARQILPSGEIGEITWFRGEHTEDFLADPAPAVHLAHQGARQRLHGRLAPHPSTACWR